MNKIIFLAFVTGILMLSSLIYAVMLSNFADEGNILLNLTWGKVALIDVYIGFLFFGVWIYLREQNIWLFLLWFIPLLLIGNLVSAIYLIYAFYQSKRDIKHFMLGKYKTENI
jgi:hypothetical protein